MESHYQPPAYAGMGSQPATPQQGMSYIGMTNGHQHPSPANDNPTLPPLQQQPASNYSHLPPLYTGAPHSASPHTPHTPGANSGVSHPNSSYSNLPTPITAGSMPPPSTSYMPTTPGYATSQAPSQHPSARVHDIRPMPANIGAYSSPMTPFPPFNPGGALPGQASHQQYVPSQEAEPTHVVGPQGRRGVLPSVPGRPQAPAAASALSAKSMIPQKDADGKYPCPQCTKTYLHAKHLKRHLLRHTGDRPYTCHLCKDTFSRSDILKRHFQKCSIRRGNPTGANHLAGQRRNTVSSAHRMSVGNNDLAGLGENAGGSFSSTVNGSPPINGDQSSYPSSMASMSARSSRANSLIQPPNAYPDGRHLAGIGLPTLASSVQNPEGMPVTSGGYAATIPSYAMRGHSLSNPVHPSTYGYGPSASNGHVYQGFKQEEPANYTASSGPTAGARAPGQGNMDWHSMMGTHAQDHYIQPGQQDPSHQNPRAEHHMAGQTFPSTEAYGEPYLNGMHAQPQAYGDDGAHRQEMIVSR